MRNYRKPVRFEREKEREREEKERLQHFLLGFFLRLVHKNIDCLTLDFLSIPTVAYI